MRTVFKQDPPVIWRGSLWAIKMKPQRGVFIQRNNVNVTHGPGVQQAAVDEKRNEEIWLPVGENGGGNAESNRDQEEGGGVGEGVGAGDDRVGEVIALWL